VGDEIKLARQVLVTEESHMKFHQNLVSSYGDKNVARREKMPRRFTFTLRYVTLRNVLTVKNVMY
jgi:hypothetical protein